MIFIGRRYRKLLSIKRWRVFRGSACVEWKKMWKKNEYEMVRVISANHVDETIAYQRLHLVEWFCGWALVVFREKRKYSNRARVRVRGRWRKYVQTSTRRATSLWYSVFVQLRATRFQADVDRIKVHYDNLIRYCDVPPPSPWAHFALIIATVLRRHFSNWFTMTNLFFLFLIHSITQTFLTNCTYSIYVQT